MITAVFTGSAICVSASAQEPSKALRSSDARNHVGKTATFEMVVVSSKDSAQRKMVYLDSEKEYDSPDNLAVLIPHESLKAYLEAGVAKPHEHYRGRTIRVTGKVVREGTQTRIYAREPKQIRVVEKPASKDEAPSSGR